MIQRIRARPIENEDSKRHIEKHLSNFEKSERELRQQERRDRANQLGMPALVMQLQ